SRTGSMRVSVMVVVLVAFEDLSARHDEDPPAGAHHLDRGAIERRQDFGRNHLVDGAEGGAAFAEIEHAIDRAEQLVELMGGEENGQPEAPAEITDEFDHHMLLMR